MLEFVNKMQAMLNASHKRVIYRTSQNFCNRKISRIVSKKGGGRNIHDKSICEGSSDTLHNTITWLLCLCASLDLWRSMRPSQYYTPLRVFSGYLAVFSKRLTGAAHFFFKEDTGPALIVIA